MAQLSCCRRRILGLPLYATDWLRLPVLFLVVPLNELAKVEQDEVLRRVSLWAYYLLRPPVFDRFLLYDLSQRRLRICFLCLTRTRVAKIVSWFEKIPMLHNVLGTRAVVLFEWAPDVSSRKCDGLLECVTGSLFLHSSLVIAVFGLSMCIASMTSGVLLSAVWLDEQYWHFEESHVETNSFIGYKLAQLYKLLESSALPVLLCRVRCPAAACHFQMTIHVNHSVYGISVVEKASEST